jgi:ankyrin repeat protein
MPDSVHEFIVAACVPIGSSHASGTLEQADAILAANPEIRASNIFAAAVLGDDSTVRHFIAASSANATAKGGPHGWDPLTYLCFSKYLRLVPERSEGFVRAAEALLNAGADPNSGFFSQEHQPSPEFESVLYGAAGVAHHAGVTGLLLERGADPNDGEVTYHTPETYDNAALKCLVGTGKLSADSLATLLLRKADWHDYEGIKYLLEQGADPNRITHWGFAGIHQALRRDNDSRNIEVMLDHGADPMLVSRSDGRSAIVIAARRGRGDVLDLLESRGIPVRLQGIEQLIAACARSDAAAVEAAVVRDAKLVEELKANGAALLAEFAGNGNTQGVRLLLDLGVNLGSLYEGDGYFDIAKNSTALHVAAWRARHDTVKLLIERGASINALDSKGRTPLALAVRACIDSYWQARRSPDSVQALLQAGASVSGVQFPSGYLAVDELLKSHGAKS